MMLFESWETEANKCKEILTRSTPKQWMAAKDVLPDAEELSVVDFCRTSGLLSEKELTITELTATSLVKNMGENVLCAEEVVIAFLKRATIGQQLVSQNSVLEINVLGRICLIPSSTQLNFAIEFMADEAIERAKELDAYYKETGKLMGPLVSDLAY
jgi:amidase